MNPDYMAKVEATAKESPEIAPQLKKLGKQPTGLWLESLRRLEAPAALARRRRQAGEDGGQARGTGVPGLQPAESRLLGQVVRG